MRLAWVLVGAALLAGCTGGRTTPNSFPKPAPKTEPPKAAATGPGQSERYRTDGKRERVWTIRWKSANLEYMSAENHRGRMEGVQGTLWRGGREKSRFAADRGEADRARSMLRLSGNVRIASPDPKATLTADEVEWDADIGVIKARGSVRVTGPWGDIGPEPEIWATPELDRIATPDQF